MHDSCGCYITPTLQLKNTIGSGLISIVEQFYEAIFEGLLPSRLTIPEIAISTAQNLWGKVKATWGGASEQRDERLWLHRQKHNIYAFSAAKSYAQLAELRDAVFEDNKRVPFTKFREKAKNIVGKYNEIWLEAEYNAVVRGTVMGRKWLDIMRDADILPYLRYKTMEDIRVRESHRLLEGIILPITDDFWKQYYPPNGWNCRCTVDQIGEDEFDKADLSDSKAAKKIAAKDTPEYWRRNIGTETIFDIKSSAYGDAMPAPELNAVKNYGMKKVSNIYDKTLPNKPKKLDLDRLEEIANEIWITKNDTIYIMYYADRPTIVRVTDAGVRTQKTVSVADAEKYRKGILLKK